ncbi:hypothetical protein L596_014092 [Steinernema carpocapsae]|uniref:DEP domain-containing protein n=1 Tax=Steinernema carpocapsae TaxID=34508 RepID=A0A4U5NAL5_STECR|nr:hypothetical protein L596_014092 [Steinernema carpocapsae]
MPGGRPPLARRSHNAPMNKLNVEAESNPQFQATKLWNRITRKFCKDVPRKRHRKALWFYENTFTGQEAVDFLLEALPRIVDENREVTREKCVVLMEKFLENDIVRGVTPTQAFRDGDLYKLSPAAEEIAQSQPFVRRAASFNDKNRNIKHSWQQNGTLSPPAKLEPLPPMMIPTSPCKLASSRRLSMSHGNLSSLQGHNNSNHQNSSLRVPKDLSFITENIVEAMPSTSTALPPLPVHAEMDVAKVWKRCLIEQTQKILGEEVLGADFDESDVKWNVEHVGTRGIVKSKSDEGELPSFIMKTMRYVARYPFDQCPDLKNVAYRGMETDAFGNVCQHLSQHSRPLPVHTAKAMLRVVTIFRERGKQRSEPEESWVHIERTPSVLPRYTPLSECNRDSQVTPLSHFRNSNVVQSMQIPTPVRSFNFRASASGRMNSSFWGHSEPEKSPEIVNQMTEICRNSAGPRIVGSARLIPQRGNSIPRSPYRPPALRDCSLLRDVLEEDYDDVFTALSLILLSLPSPTRRRLHFVLRFMQRVSANMCLKLEPSKDNRYVVLDRLVSSVLPSNQELKPSEIIALVSFLMDNESRIFSVPAVIVSAVADTLNPKTESFGSSTQSTSSVRPVSPSSQFCAMIDKASYDTQKSDPTNLRLLLSQICDNENFSEDHKKRCLKDFKRTHPEIYAERFPTSPTQVRRTTPIPKFFNKLRLRLKDL